MPGKKPIKPACYSTPLKRRRDILAWLRRNDYWRIRCYNGRIWPFCFNVKLHNVDLSFEHLLALYRQNYGTPDAAWENACRKKYESQAKDFHEFLYEMAVRDARSMFIGIKGDGVPDDDGRKILWDGRNVEPRFDFMGQSGGWLVLTKFMDETMTGTFLYASAEDGGLEGWDYKTKLWPLYQYLVMLLHDIRRPAEHVEYAAQSFFFCNTCHDVTRPATLQAAAKHKAACRQAFFDFLAAKAVRKLRIEPLRRQP